MGVTISNSTMDELAGDVAAAAHKIEVIAYPDVTAIVAACMSGSALIDATATATGAVESALTVVAGQWESMSSIVRATRSELDGVDDRSAEKFEALGALPGAPKAAGAHR